MNETKKWTCDHCKEELDADNGWVQWISYLSSENKTGHGLSLVHSFNEENKGKCLFKEKAIKEGFVSDSELNTFLGPDGLIRLLVFISEKDVVISEVLEMIKRLHIPGYEMARHYFKDAIHEGVIDPNMPFSYYSQAEIKIILDKYYPNS